MAGAAALMVKVKLLLVAAAPSLTVMVMVAVPIWLLAGVKTAVRSGPAPPSTIFEVGINAGFDELAVRIRFEAGVSISLIASGRNSVEPWVSAWLGRLEIVGGVLIGVTVKTKTALALAWPSRTRTVIVAVPNWLGVGRRATVRLEPLPPKTMLAFGTSTGLDE